MKGSKNMTPEEIDAMIVKLTELLIKQGYTDKEQGVAYIKKIDAYRDLINFFKQLKNELLFKS